MPEVTITPEVTIQTDRGTGFLPIITRIIAGCIVARLDYNRLIRSNEPNKPDPAIVFDADIQNAKQLADQLVIPPHLTVQTQERIQTFLERLGTTTHDNYTDFIDSTYLAFDLAGQLDQELFGMDSQGGYAP